jgi:hypothetical protein
LPEPAPKELESDKGTEYIRIKETLKREMHVNLRTPPEMSP